MTNLPGLNQNPTGSSWSDAPRTTPQVRRWPLAAGAIALIAVGAVALLVR